MAWIPLKSSHLEAFDYDPEMKVLHVRFQNGSIYSYRDVPATEAEGFSQAESPGRYLRDKIRFSYRTF